MKTLVSAAVVFVAAAAVFGQGRSIIDSVHNLSASGPGAVRATSEEQVCIFCHTPHHASPIQPLWNRAIPATAYNVYASDSLNASPGQPTGASKLCLSCHDGTIALGSVTSRHQPIMMAGGMTTLPPGRTNLGTDLSDDHPISFRYDQTLAVEDTKLLSPSQLPPEVRLDSRQELQCTTCHEAHNNQFGQFLVMDNSNAQLCRTCHLRGPTDIVEHQNCSSCHQPHTAPSGPHLLVQATVTDTCLTCHGGQSGQSGADQGPNVAIDLNKLSRHDTSTSLGPAGDISSTVICNSCHEPHTMQGRSAVAPLISPKLGQVSGINAAGGTVAQAQYEYEICFKCHADTNAVAQIIPRQIAQNNVRLQTAPSAVSFHPVQSPGNNDDVPSLRTDLSPASIIYCTDCHASDRAVSGAGTGPHGSNYRPLLLAGYSTADGTTEGPAAYALCYTCHDRASILNDESFPFHSKHIVDEGTPCSVCHDAHGIAAGQGTAMSNSHLINFDVSIVQPEPASQRLEYRMLGPGAGSCTLSCHGEVHSDEEY